MKNITLTPELLSDNNLNITQAVLFATIKTYMNNDVFLMSNQEISDVLNNKFKVNTIKKVIYQLRDLGYISTKRYKLSEPEYDQYGKARVIRLITQEEPEPVNDEQQRIADFVKRLETIYVKDDFFKQAIEFCEEEFNNPDKLISYEKYSDKIKHYDYRLVKL